jgi:hypothetical protein
LDGRDGSRVKVVTGGGAEVTRRRERMVVRRIGRGDHMVATMRMSSSSSL